MAHSFNKNGWTCTTHKTFLPVWHYEEPLRSDANLKSFLVGGMRPTFFVVSSWLALALKLSHRRKLGKMDGDLPMPQPTGLRMGEEQVAHQITRFYTVNRMLKHLPPDILSSMQAGDGMSDNVLTASMTASLQ